MNDVASQARVQTTGSSTEAELQSAGAAAPCAGAACAVSAVDADGKTSAAIAASPSAISGGGTRAI